MTLVYDTSGENVRVSSAQKSPLTDFQLFSISVFQSIHPKNSEETSHSKSQHGRKFQKLQGDKDILFTVVKEKMNEVLVPLYGDQERALNLIALGEDRTCELLLDEGKPVGILVYKKEPKIMSDLEFKRSLEIKTLFVFDEMENSGRGYGSALLDRAIQAAQEARARCIHLSVSETVPQSMKFLTKKGFAIFNSCKGKYKPQVEEYWLAKSVKLLHKSALDPFLLLYNDEEIVSSITDVRSQLRLLVQKVFPTKIIDLVREFNRNLYFTSVTC